MRKLTTGQRADRQKWLKIWGGALDDKDCFIRDALSDLDEADGQLADLNRELDMLRAALDEEVHRSKRIEAAHDELRAKLTTKESEIAALTEKVAEAEKRHAEEHGRWDEQHDKQHRINMGLARKLAEAETGFSYCHEQRAIELRELEALRGEVALLRSVAKAAEAAQAKYLHAPDWFDIDLDQALAALDKETTCGKSLLNRGDK